MEDCNVVALTNQRGGNMSADKAAAADQQNIHQLCSDDVVLEAEGAGLLVQALFPERQLRTIGGRREQWNAAAKQDRNQRYLDTIDQAGCEQAAKQLAAAEQGDILARLGAQLRDHAH